MDDYEKFNNLNQSQINVEFAEACGKGRIELVKYLVFSPKLKFHADIHSLSDYGLRIACSADYTEIVNFLIIEQNLEISGYLKDWLNGDNSNKKKYDYALNLIEKRELGNQLREELGSQSCKSKIKI